MLIAALLHARKSGEGALLKRYVRLDCYTRVPVPITDNP
jgi:hypothetical protein